jgi:P-type Cu+ transporter
MGRRRPTFCFPPSAAVCAQKSGKGIKLPKDPICGMPVDPNNAATTEHAGRNYYFCSTGCAQRFAQAPEKYAAATVDSSKPLAHQAPQSGAAAKPEAIAAAARNSTAAASSVPSVAPQGVRYTCPMHPQIAQMGPGACPICGMALEPMDPLAAVVADPEYDSMRKRLWISAALSLPLLTLSMLGDHLGLHIAPTRRDWIEFILATPVVLWGGWPFFQRFWDSLVHRSPNMFTLIGLGTAAAYLAGISRVFSRDGRRRARLF